MLEGLGAPDDVDTVGFVGMLQPAVAGSSHFLLAVLNSKPIAHVMRCEVPLTHKKNVPQSEGLGRVEVPRAGHSAEMGGSVEVGTLQPTSPAGTQFSLASS